MLLMVLLLMVIYHLQQPDARLRQTRPIPWPYALLSMGYIVFWAALRSGFVDTRAYILSYEFISTGWDNAVRVFESSAKSPGWEFIQIIFKTCVSRDFHWWLAAIAVASGIPLMVTLRRTSVNYLYSIFLFISTLTFSWLFNGIRQFLVAALLFGCYKLILDRRTAKFIIIVLLCSLLHKSALIILPAYFLVNSKPFGAKMMIFVLAVSSCAISVAPLMESMETVLADTAYAANLEQFAEDDGVHPLRVLLESIPVILAFIRRKKIAEKNNAFVNLCVNMSTVAAGIYFVGMFTSGIMIGRLPLFFSLYNLILIPYIFTYVYTGMKKIMYAGGTLVYLAFYFVMTQAGSYYYISDILGNYV